MSGKSPESVTTNKELAKTGEKAERGGSEFQITQFGEFESPETHTRAGDSNPANCGF
jgi:hypothetical protein